ncbi:manganese efflux pump [Pullulanibacillus sp. KACC 23026]|uniref:manganese efflux pump MntP n=1 Tax=Pullulanibacillus sp. KACC 23026 TaxID=3028315 RepID=UPI0023AF5A24|nr:manganese efflux pump [Pullulanibacillus sp. KACC 23026]WEG11857.1 manganese efflux pump [Pullulanibacillus sp. KACC 23026]
MHILTILFVGIIANVDNLVIGFSYGIKKTRIPIISNIMIACMSMVCSLIALLIGHWLSSYLKPNFAGILGGTLLIIIGGLSIWSTFYERNQKTKEISPNLVKVIYEPTTADLDFNNTISMKESIFLGLALALNSISTSFSVGLTDPSILLYILSIGLFSLLSIWIGGRLGDKLKASLTSLETFAPIVSGILLFLIGLYEVIH